MLIEWYSVIKASHIGLVYSSGSLFAVRGAGVLLGAAAPMSLPVRVVSQIIDTALLLAAILLVITLSINPLTTSWLLVKLILLVAYIALGTLALRRASTRRGKGLAFVAALACFVMMISIARSHDPLGLLRWLAL